MSNTAPRPITTLDLDILLTRLRDEEEAILALIDEDERLKKRERSDGLIIANSGPTLFEPVEEHHLYAKGIVYRREPSYALVSIPLVKMFNHGLREHSDGTSQALLARGEVGFAFPDKLDGTMIQLFGHGEGVVLTTRSVLEGVEIEEEGPYLALAREVLKEQDPALLGAGEVEGLTLIFELIHPKTRQVTNYGAQRKMVLLSIFDHATYHYWSNARVVAWAKTRDVAHAEILIDDDDFERGVETLRARLGEDPDVPEGSIVCFEKEGRIVHRVKVKTQEYLHHFALRMKVTYKTVVEMLWAAPELHDWETFLAHLIDQKMSEEEVEAFYREYFDEFIAWKHGVEAAHARIEGIVSAWVEAHGPRPTDDGEQRAWYKSLAATMKAEHPEDFPHIMGWARKEGLTLEQMMWHNPPYPGFRATLQQERDA